VRYRLEHLLKEDHKQGGREKSPKVPTHRNTPVEGPRASPQMTPAARGPPPPPSVPESQPRRSNRRAANYRHQRNRTGYDGVMDFSDEDLPSKVTSSEIRRVRSVSCEGGGLGISIGPDQESGQIALAKTNHPNFKDLASMISSRSSLTEHVPPNDA